MNKLKKFLACLLALVMILSMVPMSALAVASDADCGYCEERDANGDFVCDVCGWPTFNVCAHGACEILYDYIAPTCTDAGQCMTIYCKSGDSWTLKHTEESVTPYYGGKLPTPVAIPATGHTDDVVCKTCGKVTVRVCEHDSEDLTVVQEYKAPTCDEEGHQMVVKCSVDGEYVVYADGTFSATDPKVIPALDHETYTEVVIVSEPTCVDRGSKRFDTYCHNCDYYREGLPFAFGEPTGVHDTYTQEVIISNPTCVDRGSKRFDTYCQNCDYYREGLPYDFGEPTGVHDTYTQEVIISNPTCVDRGSKRFDTYCQNCDYYREGLPYDFGDPLDHDWNDGEITTPATCAADGVMTYTCLRDSSHTYTEPISATGEHFDQTTDKDHKCDVCEKVLSDCVDEDKDINHLCDVCGNCVIDVCGYGCDNHEIKQYYKAPTCEEDGHYMVVHCGRASTSTGGGGDYVVYPDGTFSAFDTDVIPALNHSETREDRMDPNCTKTGYVKTYCKFCDKLISEETLPTNDDHAFHNGKCLLCGKPEKCEHTEVRVDRMDPNCSKEGYVNTYCKECDELLSEEVLPTNDDHAFHNGKCLLCGACDHDYVVVREQAPNCVEYGYVWYECSRCGAEKNHEAGEPDPTAHDYVVVRELAPTCTEAGYVWYECSLCGAEKNHEVGEVDPTAHDYVVVKELAPTCTEAGYVWKECSLCGAEKNHEVGEVDPTAHDYVVVKELAPTCTEAGYVWKECSLCGAEKNHEVGEPDLNNHDMDEGEITTPATCVDKGVKTYTCKRGCGHTVTEDVEIDPENHTGETVTKNESETYSGDIHCADCDALLEEGKVIAVPSTPITPAKPTWKNWLDKVINNWKDKIECPEEPTEPEETVPEETEPEETEPEETVPAAPVVPAKPNWGSIIRGCWNWIFR